MELLKTNEEMESKIEKFQDSIFLNVGPSIKKIALNSILFVQAYGDYMKVVCEGDNHLVYVTMQKIVELLPSDEFFRIHRSYLIRIDKIDQIFTKSIRNQENADPNRERQQRCTHGNDPIDQIEKAKPSW